MTNLQKYASRSVKRTSHRTFQARVVIECMGMLGLLCGTVCAADSIDLDVNTPAIERLKAASAGRAELVAQNKDYGYVGEGQDGLLKVRTLVGIKLSEKKSVEDLVEAENTDRRALYRELLNAHKLGESEAGKVMGLAAARRRKEAAPGHWVERLSDGKWALARDLKE